MTEIKERPLLERVFTPSDSKRFNIIIKWLEENATFAHVQEDEFILAVPPILSKEKYIKVKYGNDMPEEIAYILNQAIDINGEKPDPGYVLIFLVAD
jgi:hypothetical protein